MGGSASLNAAELREIELCGVQLEQRAQGVAFAERLLRQGLSDLEVRPALEQFFKKNQWVNQSPCAPYGIVRSAREAMRLAEEAVAAANTVRSPEVLVDASLAAVSPEPMGWLWPEKIPVGKVTVVYGAMGLVKTCWSLDLATRVSAGVDWPEAVSESDGEERPAPGKVVLINGEDSLSQTIQPRLARSGAVLQNITAISGIASGGPEGAVTQRRFDLSRDLSLLRQRIESLGDVRLVIIDPLEASCGGIRPSSWRMRVLLAELEILAAECGLAVVIISAANKCDLPVKNVWRVDADELDPELRWWVPVKSIGGAQPAAAAFRVTTNGLAWDSQTEPFSPERVRGTPDRAARQGRLKEVAAWLQGHLEHGPCAAREVLQAGDAAGWSASQVKRAKLALRVKCYKEPVALGRWIWDVAHRSARPVPVTNAAVNAPAASEEPANRAGILFNGRVDGANTIWPKDPLEWLDRASQVQHKGFEGVKAVKEHEGNRG